MEGMKNVGCDRNLSVIDSWSMVTPFLMSWFLVCIFLLLVLPCFYLSCSLT